MKNILKKWLREPSPQAPAFDPVTVDFFRQEPERVERLRTFLQSPTGREMLGAMYSNVPHGYPLRGENTTDTQAAIELGRVNGFMDCLHLLRLLATYPAPVPEPVESTFEAENQEEP